VTDNLGWWWWSLDVVNGSVAIRILGRIFVLTVMYKKPSHRMTYTCQPCVYQTTSKRDYERHLLTQKHLDGGNIGKTPIKTLDGYSCPICHNIYKSRTSTYTHIAKCGANNTQNGPNHTNSIPQFASTTPLSTPTEQYLLDVLVKNQELTSAMMILIQQNTELQSKMIELCVSNTTNNTTTNTNSHNTMTNCHNPTFNMNLFLNEKCKDAMNMTDFVNSIQLNMTDMENVSRLGYVEGMSNIFIDNLQKTDLYKRPVHCSDVKRETLYVKEDNQWERDGPDHMKMTNAVLAVEQKNVALVNEWAKANPRCMNSNTRENETYVRLAKAVTDGEKDGNIDKVIRKVAKKVAIEKANPSAIEDS
jgi:hypothetical protein